MTIKTTIRFNTDKPAEKRALDYLQTARISYSKAVVKAINAYLDLQAEEERKASFLREVRNTIREELRANPMLAFLDAFDSE